MSNSADYRALNDKKCKGCVHRDKQGVCCVIDRHCDDDSAACLYLELPGQHKGKFRGNEVSGAK